VLETVGAGVSEKDGDEDGDGEVDGVADGDDDDDADVDDELVADGEAPPGDADGDDELVADNEAPPGDADGDGDMGNGLGDEHGFDVMQYAPPDQLSCSVISLKLPTVQASLLSVPLTLHGYACMYQRSLFCCTQLPGIEMGSNHDASGRVGSVTWLRRNCACGCEQSPRTRHVPSQTPLSEIVVKIKIQHCPLLGCKIVPTTPSSGSCHDCSGE
jgi:hypothetical protein